MCLSVSFDVQVEKQQEATKAVNRKKQKEIARRLKLKRQEEKVEAEAEALRFEHKTNTVNKRLEDHEDAKMTALAARFAEQARQLAARDARNAELLKQKTMAAGSTLNLAEMKALVSEQVMQKKIDRALGRWVSILPPASYVLRLFSDNCATAR